MHRALSPRSTSRNIEDADTLIGIYDWQSEEERLDAVTVA